MRRYFATAIIASLCLGVAAQAEESPEARWRSVARSVGLTTFLTPAEEGCYRHLSSCFSSLTADQTPTSYYLTRLYVHIAQRVVNGTLKPKDMPVEPREYDQTFASSAEQKIVDDAVMMNIRAIIG